ncbi:MipA/OmpV family protein [Pelomonas sp. KK5]|uniref:MipA/OmpV family protein n=1 Tax=Pelomonas sp. KK5 TaxID=1855730 RepID=UPI00097C1467|nr:MipA/OmpV family protein [Pelomonas sp. KK5]
MLRILSPLVLLLPLAALADEAPAPDPAFRYLIGGRLHTEPEYAGATRYTTRLSPLWAIQWGRLRISTSGGSGLLGFGSEVRGDGASADLIEGSRLRLGVALRVDNGRSSGDASTTRGLPDVRRTVRGRVYAGYALTPDWLVSTSLSQDLLGRHGGMAGGVDLGWRLRQSRHLEWTAGGGVSFGNAAYLRSYFGVTPEGSVATGLPAYEPGSGLRDVHAGMGWTWQLAPSWIAFGSASVSQLLGPAADSPLTQRRFGGQLAAGISYRN